MKIHLDQFYTNEEIAKKCIKDVENVAGSINTWKNILEPSAGNGSFFNFLPNHAIGLDLEPKAQRIIKTDYLLWHNNSNLKNFIVIGNPPFGKNSSLAVKFFNKSAEFAELIAFIVPRTFRKSSIINRLNRNFLLVFDSALPANSFHTSDGALRDVSTCFQIWKRSQTNRERIQSKPAICPDWEWTTSKVGATHAIRRVGCNAGKLIPIEKASPSSHFFIKSNVERFTVKYEKLWNECWQEEKVYNSKWDVAGNPSLTKQEIVSAYLEMHFNS